jgi:hypothetical protein
MLSHIRARMLRSRELAGMVRHGAMADRPTATISGTGIERAMAGIQSEYRAVGFRARNWNGSIQQPIALRALSVDTPDDARHSSWRGAGSN